MSHLTIQVQPPLKFIPPNFKPLVRTGTKLMLPWWLKYQISVADVQVDNLETLAQLYQNFHQGKNRFLMAFRHPNANDPYCLGYMIWYLLPKFAKQQGITLPSLLHYHFIFDRGIPLWAGNFVGKWYSYLGGSSIHRGKIDRQGLKSARELFANGSLPMMAAPEGSTNGHNERVSPLEPGIAQMGFWCVEDIYKATRSEEVLIVPVGIQYKYLGEPWENVEKLLTKLEKDSGLFSSSENLPNQQKLAPSALYQRLLRLGGHLLEKMEEFYRKFYHRDLPKSTQESSSQQSLTDDQINETIVTRLNALLNVALEVAEEYFQIQANGNFIDRCRRLEQAGWDFIYREDIENLATLSPVDRGLADRLAQEASLRMWHMRLVESFVAVSGKYITEKPTIERFADTTLLIWDMINRIKGGNPLKRPILGKQKVYMTVGQPISVSQRWESYKAKRRTAISELTQDLQKALEETIK
ncbi:MAG: 1-acyl-sn-glycerol-3-phosphate acyltransferase [Okeania sp. SIO2C9]|uniref:1-acyl-sn-glycerol-3-phosphate acyltransferase n=1 Tax=Okeania sp. SIO2C9 TaxID=2607791 RepID=UPI0013C1AC25|nr:1-acyl-sn-glycerol-3-phosphate acyltransferase [Okeania sp. SIO2C9]NEQ78040.1 1-acyl-sn-glycerol-3-phosphate acyltransferase [Okeania sp. SIO2C9]